MSDTGATARAHQPLPPENDKTIIRQAIETDSEAKAKLRDSNTADGVGDAPYFVPEPQSDAVPCDRLTQEMVVLVLHRSRSKTLCSVSRGITVSRADHSLALPEQRRHRDSRVS
jgi:hypothetical protein